MVHVVDVAFGFVLACIVMAMVNAIFHCWLESLIRRFHERRHRDHEHSRRGQEARG